jgi:hypothetical protein
MAKTQKARTSGRHVALPSEPEVRAAMAKAIREVRRNAEAKNISLAVAGKKS